MQVTIYVPEEKEWLEVKEAADKRGMSASAYLLDCHKQMVGMRGAKKESDVIVSELGENDKTSPGQNAAHQKKKKKPHVADISVTHGDEQTAGYVDAVKGDAEEMRDLTHDEKLKRLKDMTPTLGAANDLKPQLKDKDK